MSANKTLHTLGTKKAFLVIPGKITVINIHALITSVGGHLYQT